MELQPILTKYILAFDNYVALSLLTFTGGNCADMLSDCWCKLFMVCKGSKMLGGERLASNGCSEDPLSCKFC